MVEKVAEAVQAEIKRRASEGFGNGYAEFGDDGLIVDTTLNLQSVSRVAIEAMREPTDAQVLAFTNATINQWATEAGLRIGYTAMIDAALTPQEVEG